MQGEIPAKAQLGVEKKRDRLKAISEGHKEPNLGKEKT